MGLDDDFFLLKVPSWFLFSGDSLFWLVNSFSWLTDGHFMSDVFLVVKMLEFGDKYDSFRHTVL